MSALERNSRKPTGDICKSKGRLWQYRPIIISIEANIRHLAEEHSEHIIGWPKTRWSDTPANYDESEWGQGILHWTIGKWDEKKVMPTVDILFNFRFRYRFERKYEPASLALPF